MYKGEEEKRFQGVNKSVIKSSTSFEDYKKCLFGGEKQFRKMNVIRSRKHEIFMEEVNKVALSANDDKRIILSDKVHTHAHGHYSRE